MKYSMYSVEYYYLATGMEGNPDVQYYGIVSAESENAAIEEIAEMEYPKPGTKRDFFKGCLSAKMVNFNLEKALFYIRKDSEIASRKIVGTGEELNMRYLFSFYHVELTNTKISYHFKDLSYILNVPIGISFDFDPLDNFSSERLKIAWKGNSKNSFEFIHYPPSDIKSYFDSIFGMITVLPWGNWLIEK